MSKAKGKYYERRAQRILEAAGYHVTLAGASLGLFDLIALNARTVRCVQVKGGVTPSLSAVEREALATFQVPVCCTKEVWRFFRGRGTPEIEILCWQE